MKTWQDCNNWDEVFANDNIYNEYVKDINKYYNFQFEWEKIFNSIKLDNKEYSGIIKVKNNKLIIDKLSSGSHNKSKIIESPGIFIFHTHPPSDPLSCLPSDSDILQSYIHKFNNYYLANILINEYGVFFYCPYHYKMNEINGNPKLLYLSAFYTLSLYYSLPGLNSYTISSIINKYNEVGFDIRHVYKIKKAKKSYNKLLVSNIHMVHSPVMDRIRKELESDL